MKPLFKIGNRSERSQSDGRTMWRLLREMEGLGLIRLGEVVHRDEPEREAVYLDDSAGTPRSLDVLRAATQNVDW